MASRKEQKERLRQERLEREREAAAADRRKRLVGFGVAGALVAAALIALAVVALAGGDGDGGGGGSSSTEYPDDGKVPAQRTTDLQAAARAAGCRLEDPPDRGNAHVTTRVRYRDNPPVSGNHDPVPSEDDVYTKAPRTENLLHSHEHGRIVIQFRPGLAEDARANLKAFYDDDPYHMILTPNGTRMPYDVAATTWGHQLLCKRMNDRVFDAIRAFRERYRDKGPEFVP